MENRFILGNESGEQVTFVKLRTLFIDLKIDFIQNLIDDRSSVESLEWAVRTARRMVPLATCLTQALALHHLLARAGYESSIHIGVAKTAGRGFEAHAWVEHAGVTLLSSPSEVAHYSRLLALRAPSL